MARQIPPRLEWTFRKKTAAIDALAAGGKLAGRQVVLFGATLDSHWIIEHLRGLGVEVVATVDNAAHKSGASFAGVGVVLPEEFLVPRRSDVVVLISSPAYSYEMAKQVEELGYRPDTDFFIVDGAVRGHRALIRMQLIAVYRIARGYLIYRRLVRTYGRDRRLLLCPYAGTGDSYLIGRYLDAYLAQNRIDSYALIANGRLVGRILAMFGHQVTGTVDESQKDFLLDAFQFLGPDIMRMKVLLFWGYRVRPGINPRFTDLVPSFDAVFRHDVFGLEPGAVPKLPVFEQDEDAVDAFFAEHRLEKGRTVVLAPYMGIFWNVEIPAAFWERLAAELTRRGYRVCTNSSGPDEPVIAGTEGVFFPLAQAVPILDAAGHFVAIRSGFCDVVSTTTASTTVLYLAASNVVPIHFFSLEKMGLKSDVHEYEYVDDIDKLLDQTLSHF